MSTSILRLVPSLALLGQVVANAIPRQANVDSCPGYEASNVVETSTGLTADLTLAGDACNVYGTDIQDLTLTVEYQTGESYEIQSLEAIALTLSGHRLHVLIQDQANQVYQVPESVFTRPSTEEDVSPDDCQFDFNYIANPFSFSVTRRNASEVLFDTTAAALIFESQYLRLRTELPQHPSLYGLGEHTDPL